MTPPPRIRFSPHRQRDAPRARAWAAVGISAAVHVGVALLIALIAASRAQQVPRDRPTAPTEQVSFVDIGAWPGAVAPPAGSDAMTGPRGPSAVTASTRRRPAEAADTSEAPPPDDAGPGDAAGSVGVDPTPSGGAPPAVGGTRWALSPELGDARLVPRPLTARENAPAEVERYRSQFMAAYRAMRDSVQGEVDTERRIASWTWMDPQGRAWGVRQGRLVIAGQETIYVEMAGERDQAILARQQARQRREGMRQAEDIERDRHLRERTRAVRERRDREREAGRP